MSRSAPVLVLAVLAVLAFPSGSEAQRFARPLGPPGQDAMEEGGRLYEEGRQAVDEYRWSDAIEPLLQAYRLTGAAVALYGLGLAFRAIGRVRDARDAFDQLLEDHAAELDESMREQALEMHAEAAASVAVIALGELGGVGEQRIQLDGSAVDDDGERPLPLETDPGAHAVRVDRDGHVPFQWEGTLTVGERVPLEVTLEPEAPPLWTRPWLWGAVGGAVVVIAIVVAAVAQSAAQLDPRSEHVISL
jgi:hypothetical protein